MTDQFPTHGGQLRQIGERFGIPTSQLIDFSVNINPDGPPPSVFTQLQLSLKDPATLGSYPDLDQTQLKQAIASYTRVSSANISVANGFVPLLEVALRALPIQHCLLPVPAFVEYGPALTRAQVRITPQALNPESDFSYNIQAMLSGEHDAILLANPQNPSGVSSSRHVLLRLVESAAKRNIVLLLDEAFIDYTPEDSLASHVNNFPNLIVFRSVTKFHGIPGMRVAYLISAPTIVRSIDECLPPWPITTLATKAVIAALADDSYADRTRLLNNQRRSILLSRLKELGLQVYSSAANFLLFRLPLEIPHNDFWQRMIVDHHVVLRDCVNYQFLPAGHLRVAVRTEQENELLLNALTKTLVTFRVPMGTQSNLG
jgi:threonine-phosphate decarboxylase